ARLGDRITHTNAYAGLIAGALAGAVIAALCVTTGGIGAVALAAAGGAGLGGAIGEFAGGFEIVDTGQIVGASDDTVGNAPRAARATDLVACRWHGGNQRIAEGSGTVLVNGLPAARIGDRTTCGAEIATGSADILIEGPKRQMLPIDPEVPLVAELIVGALGLVGGVGAIATAARGTKLLMGARLGAGLAGGLGAGYAGNEVGGAMFGEGSRGQRQMALGSGLLGGTLASGVLGGRLDPFNYRLSAEPGTLGMNGGNMRLNYAGRPPAALTGGAPRATLRGQEYEMPGMRNEPFDYVKRTPEQTRALRNEFDRGARRDFAKDLATNRADELRAANVSEADIAMLGKGNIPRDMQVHHIRPLDDGGTNAPENLVLIRNNPDHQLLTNHQRATVGDLTPGQTRRVDWPVPPPDARVWPTPGQGARPVGSGGPP
ncbi:MAG: PAAR domain-containing protein, partial [Sphingomonas sp.]